MKRTTLLFLIVLLSSQVFAQSYQQPNAAAIKQKLKKLNTLASVLYMAAHPDDENTRVITYMANEKLAATGYLALTRGDGGQNLIGPELRDLLGVIRTQELLAARRIDGGQQFFTRANDFGFSKSPIEAFQIWGKEAVLSDAIRVIRQFQPDIIITRFPPDERAGHGHHTGSAMVALEAFDLTGRADVFPEQVKQFGTWQVKRLYTNTGRWWNTKINETTPGVIAVDIGAYNPLLGASYNEIAARSGSQHRSQGWGQSGARGQNVEFFEYQKGDSAKRDFFEGINTTWTRVEGGQKVGALVSKALAEFSEENPAASVPLLLTIRKEIKKLKPSVWKERKLQEVETLITECMGLYVEVRTAHYKCPPGENFQFTAEVVNRSATNATLISINGVGAAKDSTMTTPLKQNIKLEFKSNAQVLQSTPYSDPYWLKKPHGTGLFEVENEAYIGMPENDPAVRFVFRMTIGTDTLSVVRPAVFKWTDRVTGERWRPFEIVPPVFLNPTERVVIFPNANKKVITVRASSASGQARTYNLRVELPQGWTSEPASYVIELKKRDEEVVRTFTITPPAGDFSGFARIVAESNGIRFDKSLQRIEYEHIPTQTLLPPSDVKIVRMNLEKFGSRIAYIQGAGDEIPAALRNIGYEVWEMKDSEVTLENLRKNDAVVFGIRAVNTNESIRLFMKDVLAYVEEGGTVVMQYNTSQETQIENFAPFPIKLGRERVTMEDAEVTLIDPNHPALQTPNKITKEDFSGWVQERGLYFPSSWDANFKPLLSMRDRSFSDKEEKVLESGILVAAHGKGQFVYTSLSFFRQLPDGVPGAFRLFANLTSLGRAPEQPSKVNLKLETKGVKKKKSGQ